MLEAILRASVNTIERVFEQLFPRDALKKHVLAYQFCRYRDGAMLNISIDGRWFMGTNTPYKGHEYEAAQTIIAYEAELLRKQGYNIQEHVRARVG